MWATQTLFISDKVNNYFIKSGVKGMLGSQHFMKINNFAPVLIIYLPVFSRLQSVLDSLSIVPKNRSLLNNNM